MSTQIAPLQSSTLSRAEYFPETEELHVYFHAGVVYRYFFVPETVFDTLRASSSAGRYYRASIRHQYAYRRYADGVVKDD